MLPLFTARAMDRGQNKGDNRPIICILEGSFVEKALLWARRNGISCKVERMCSGHDTLYVSADGEGSHLIASAVYKFAAKNPKFHVDPVNRIGYRLWLRADYDAAQRWFNMRRAASNLFFMARNPDHYSSEQRAAAEALCRSYGLEPVLCAAVGIDAVGMEV